MDKLAQERGLLNKLHEKANITGKILESLNPEFQEMMEKLRSTDERIRSHAEQVKDNVRSAKSHLNRRDYLSSATNISAFHERCRWIAAELQKFINGVDMKHYKFLLDQFDDEQKEQLFGYDPNKEINLDEGDASMANDRVITAALRKQAGLSDWWFKMTDPLADLAHNLTTNRGNAMRALEKRFSISFLKDLKTNSIIMVAKTQKFLQFLIQIFKRLSAALAKRNVDQYVEAAKSFISKFAGYHQQFVKFYEKSVSPLKQQYEKLIEATRAAEEEKSRKLEEGATQKREEAERKQQFEQGGMQQKIEEKFQPGQSVAPKQPASQPNLPNEEELGEDNIPIPLTQRKSNIEFINKLEKIASLDDPKSLMLQILAYSEKLEDLNPNTSLKLLAIAEGMIEDYKQAGIFDFFKNKEEEEVKKPLVSAPKLPEQKDPLL